MPGIRLAALAAAVVALAGCTPAPQQNRAEVKDKLYAVTPATIKVKSGMLSGEMIDMKITERVEEGSGRIDTPARLTAKLVLKNVSPDQTLRLLGGNVVYIDTQGKPIALEKNRTEPSLKLSAYGSQERLDPGQETSQSVEAEFPADGLKGKRLKEIRVDLQYIPSAYRQESLRFGVAVGE
jgi:hypothetical protein